MRTLLILLAAAGLQFNLAAEEAVPAGKPGATGTLSRLPIKELTVFKDGHALVAHEGQLPTDDRGNVVMDYLPTPVVGTFWAYSANPAATITSVVAAQRRTSVERTALSLPDLLAANVGAEVVIEEAGTNRYSATILGIPTRSSAELAASSPPGTPEALPVKGNIILLKTTEGIRAVNIDQIQRVTFSHGYKPAGAEEEFRNALTLNLDWGRTRPAKTANVGIFYLQKGFRWIPSYKIELDGESNAVVKLQATLVNELADIDDVSLNLVVGVPTFQFKDTIDPIALQQNLAQLSSYFQNGNPMDNNRIASQFGNAIMSQQIAVPRPDESAAGGGVTAGDLGPDIAETGKTEDLFVFRVQHITLRKGERMVLPVAQFTLPYHDVFTLELPFAPPPEMQANVNMEQERELARLMAAPKVMHKIRLLNSSKFPLTTAPALILQNGRVLAQGMTTYTAIGGNADINVTTAVDVPVKTSDLEAKRSPNALDHNGTSYFRVDFAGKITLMNHRARGTELEVTRYVLGAADTADHDGKVEALNAFENGDWLGAGAWPSWWGWYSWPSWWANVNGIGRISWKFTLPPDQTLTLEYNWHYFWP